MLELIRTDSFKQIPDHERNYAPMSEYLFKLLQPLLDDILFIGKSYERVFDEFEVILDESHCNAVVPSALLITSVPPLNPIALNGCVEPFAAVV